MSVAFANLKSASPSAQDEWDTSVSGETAARQSNGMGAVSDEPSSNMPPGEAVTGELESTELLPLVQAIAQGNTVALTSLYDATVGKVVAVARAVLRNVEDAEEVTCDVYTQAWQTAHRFDETRGSVLGWLLTIAHNRSIDLLCSARLPRCDGSWSAWRSCAISVTRRSLPKLDSP